MHGVISGGSKQSVEAGATIIRAGGNALDAVLAAAFATTSGEASITSMAGGGALIHCSGKSGKIEVCDFFANAPGLGGRRLNAATGSTPESGKFPDLDFQSMLVNFGTTTQEFYIGRGAAAVPGTIPGLLAAWKKWGSLPLNKILEPAIRILREGFSLGKFQSHCFQLLAKILKNSGLGRKHFFDANGNTLGVGEFFNNSVLADTLEALASEGADDFYETEIIKKMSENFGEGAGGWLTEEDFLEWKPEFRSPLVFGYGGGKIFTNPSPSVGGRYIEKTLDLLQAVDLRACQQGSAERFRKLAAVFRVISELRNEKPDFLEDQHASKLLQNRLHNLLSGCSESMNGDEASSPLGNTVHISTVDSEGNAAGVTLSHGEGNGHEIEGTGIFMNNFLGEKDLFPEGFHRFIPGERLKTMMAPTIVKGPEGDLYVLGSGGSNRIRTAMAQVISGILDDQLDIEAAVNRGRVHFEGGIFSAELTSLSGDGPEALNSARELARKSIYFREESLFFGGVNIACRHADGRLSGFADPRREGTVQIVDEPKSQN